MSTDQPDKPRFEPPPWEQDAFQRFRREQEEAKKREELQATLRAVRERAEERAAGPATQGETQQSPSVAPPESETRSSGEGAEAPVAGAIPEAEIDAMLVQLRGEEKPVVSKSMGLINTVIGFMVTTGVIIIVQAARLFADARSSRAAGTMLAATLSFMVFLTGAAFVGGAILLFRKYHM